MRVNPQASVVLSTFKCKSDCPLQCSLPLLLAACQNGVTAVPLHTSCVQACLFGLFKGGIHLMCKPFSPLLQERSYHIFYMLCGGPPDLVKRLRWASPHRSIYSDPSAASYT